MSSRVRFGAIRLRRPQRAADLIILQRCCCAPGLAACKGSTYAGKKTRKLSRPGDHVILDAKRRLIRLPVAAPEKINCDTELPLYKQITILSNNLICAEPTENSLKNQSLKPPLNQRL